MTQNSMPQTHTNVVPLFAQRFEKAPQINEMLKRVAKAHNTKAGRLAEAILFKVLSAEVAKLETKNAANINLNRKENKNAN